MVLCNVCNCHLFQCCFTCLCSVLYFSWIKIFHNLQWRFTHLWLNDWPIFTFIQRGVSMGVCLKLGQELSGGKMNWRGRLTGLGRPECREEPFEGFTQDFWTWIWNSLFSVFLNELSNFLTISWLYLFGITCVSIACFNADLNFELFNIGQSGSAVQSTV